MNDHTELETLRDRVADLERRLNEHENMRSTAIGALGMVQGSIERLQRRMILIPPEVTASRQEHWLEESATLRTRCRGIEEWLRDLTKIVIDDLGEIRDMLKRDPTR